MNPESAHDLHGIQSERDSGGADDLLDALLRARQRDHPNFPVIPIRRMNRRFRFHQRTTMSRFIIICREDRKADGKPGMYVQATRKHFEDWDTAVAYAKAIHPAREPIVIDVEENHARQIS